MSHLSARLALFACVVTISGSPLPSVAVLMMERSLSAGNCRLFEQIWIE